MHSLKNLDRSVFAKTRAEELGDDIWELFFVPPYWDRLHLRDRTKPIAIQGGRGCGKTMLLRYLSHATTFSRRRKHIEQGETRHIGLYWRIDTQFCNSMRNRGLTDSEWIDAFKHYLALTIARELLEALYSIAHSAFESFDETALERLEFSRLRAFDSNVPTALSAFRDYIEDQLWHFQGWASNVARQDQKPVFLPGVSFVSALIELIKRSTPSLANACFYVYIDEFENFSEYQWRIINDAVKHSRAPLIFNTAMKRGAVLVTETTGRESISGVNDFDTIDLEDELNDDAEVFFSEILLGGLETAQGEHESKLLHLLRDPSRINERRTPQHIEDIRQKVKQILPSITAKEVASEIFASPSLKKIVVERFEKTCRIRGLSLEVWRERLWRDDLPEVTVLLPHLLSRHTIEPADIEKEINNYAENKANRFNQGGWLHNNLFAAELEIYRPYQRTCPLYAGFEAFCTLSRTNLRAFLSLCHRSLELSQLDETPTGRIPVSIQAQGALDSSSKFLREIRTFGSEGERLYGFTHRLGNLFKTLQNTLELSEPEQNQFSITSGGEVVTDLDQRFIAEAVKHSVLFEFRETKTKQMISSDIVDYQLNPIYCPYFNISYRKKRKVELTSSQFIRLIRGSVDEYQDVVKEITTRRQKRTDTSTQSLFDIE